MYSESLIKKNNNKATLVSPNRPSPLPLASPFLKFNLLPNWLRIINSVSVYISNNKRLLANFHDQPVTGVIENNQ